jgi:predicted GH43/DUF377 family glycosyl hydrolase
MPITVNRRPNRFCADPKRVIARFFMHGEEKAAAIIEKVLAMSDENALLMLNQVLRDFSRRHRNITKLFEKHFAAVKDLLPSSKIHSGSISNQKTLLIGSYFTFEYSIESAALFNPSIIEHPDQTHLEKGKKRIILSFRATGEGHISSLVFRSGEIDRDSNFHFQPAGNFLDEAEVVKRHVYDKKEFFKKLDEMNVHKDIVGIVMDKLKDKFIYGELQASIEETNKSVKMTYTKQQVIQSITWLANSHYEITFSLDTAISERVIFPVSYSESNGIEDARFVRFVDVDGDVTYYATYTAYNGFTILPKLLETKDFYHFKIVPLNGKGAQNKNLALFPRRIRGKYAMVSRLDGRNHFIMFSDTINLWQKSQQIREPKYPWEFIQIGNCGSPIETEKGWLLITHGVGPMRKYCLGTLLLDLDDPTKIIGELAEPLLIPNDEEREGYVPNVLYSCGSIIHNNTLILPYAMSDSASTIATVPLDELLSQLL